MFVDFLFTLRAYGIRVTPTEWMTLMEALSMGLGRANLSTFYTLARSVLVKSEAQFDRYDQAFAEFFEGVERQFDLSDELLQWLSDPILPRELTEEERAQLAMLDIDRLREEFEKRLKEQKERHDGGSHWVGTGGTSPFGSGGTNPAGARVGAGGGRSAAQVASERRFANLRNDRVLDTRQIGTALKRLRRLNRSGARTELDIDETVDKTCRDGGEISLVFGPERKNRLKLLLLMDVGGSMDAFATTCERLFSAAHASTHFKAFEYRYFHNCVYDELYTDMANLVGEPTDDVLRRIDSSWRVLIVGDAYMHPYELLQMGGAIDYRQINRVTGKDWLMRIRERVPDSVWLNPMVPRFWNAPTIAHIRTIFPMFPLTVDGLTESIELLRGARKNAPDLQMPSRGT